jgi:succinate--hydroxymethylglutarate CoA-transferase
MVKITRAPTGLPEETPTIRLRPPLIGEHTSQVMKELGYTETDIESLISDGIIFQYPVS